MTKKQIAAAKKIGELADKYFAGQPMIVNYPQAGRDVKLKNTVLINSPARDIFAAECESYMFKDGINFHTCGCLNCKGFNISDKTKRSIEEWQS